MSLEVMLISGNQLALDVRNIRTVILKIISYKLIIKYIIVKILFVFVS